MKDFRVISFLILGILLLQSCIATDNGSTDFNALSAKSPNGWNAVIEIPAGTNIKLEYDKQKEDFTAEKIEGKPRTINFLPYPGNYGFIPGTLMEKDKGGDGDALDVLVIAAAVPTGTVMEVMAIAALILKDGGELDTKIIAVPVDPNLRVIKATNTQEFFLEYDAAKRIIENWFLNYKGWGIMEMVRWEDEDFANKEIKKWVVSQ